MIPPFIVPFRIFEPPSGAVSVSVKRKFNAVNVEAPVDAEVKSPREMFVGAVTFPVAAPNVMLDEPTVQTAVFRTAQFPAVKIPNVE